MAACRQLDFSCHLLILPLNILNAALEEKNTLKIIVTEGKIFSAADFLAPNTVGCSPLHHAKLFCRLMPAARVPFVLLSKNRIKQIKSGRSHRLGTLSPNAPSLI